MKVFGKLDPAYIESKRAQLLTLRDRLQSATRLEEGEKADVQQESVEHAQAYEDDAQKLELLETTSNRLRHDVARLAQINRALRKIEEGTYGHSDVSGQRISTDRLDALPEATNTLQEQKARE